MGFPFGFFIGNFILQERKIIDHKDSSPHHRNRKYHTFQCSFWKFDFYLYSLKSRVKELLVHNMGRVALVNFGNGGKVFKEICSRKSLTFATQEMKSAVIIMIITIQAAVPKKANDQIKCS